jgi:hypothetical protein
MIPSRAVEDEALVVIQKGPPPRIQEPTISGRGAATWVSIVLPEKEMVWMV